MSRNIQSIRFNREYFTPGKSRKYLKEHGLKPIKKMHTTKGFYIFRLLEPNQYKKYFTKKLNNEINLIIGIN